MTAADWLRKAKYRSCLSGGYCLQPLTRLGRGPLCWPAPRGPDPRCTSGNVVRSRTRATGGGPKHWKLVGGSCKLGGPAMERPQRGRPGRQDVFTVRGEIIAMSFPTSSGFFRLSSQTSYPREFPASQNRNFNLLGLNAPLVLSALHAGTIIKFSQRPHFTDTC